MKPQQSPQQQRRRSTQPTGRSGSLSTILAQPGNLPKPQPKAAPAPTRPSIFQVDEEEEEEQQEVGMGQAMLASDERAEEREEALSLEHLREVVERAGIIRGILAWLFAPFTKRVRLLHARLETIEAKLLAILGDRQAASENTVLAERVAQLEGQLTAERNLYKQKLCEQTDRAVRLKNVLLEVSKRRALPMLAEIATGKQAVKEDSVKVVEETERLVIQTLAMDTEAFGEVVRDEQPQRITTSPLAAATSEETQS